MSKMSGTISLCRVGMIKPWFGAYTRSLAISVGLSAQTWCFEFMSFAFTTPITRPNQPSNILLLFRTPRSEAKPFVSRTFCVLQNFVCKF